MLKTKESILDEDEFEDSEDEKKRKKSKKLKNRHGGYEKDDQYDEDEDDSEDSEDEEEDEERQASFFAHLEQEFQEDEESTPKGLTEAEARDAVSAIVDGLGRELREEFEHAEDSTVAELQAVVVAAFVDSLREKIEDGGNDITEELLDEALRETLEDLLGVDDNTEVDLGVVEDVGVDQNDGANGGGSNFGNGGGGNNNGNNSSGGGSYYNASSGGANPTSSGSSAVVAFVAANKVKIDDPTVELQKGRGRGLLIGGIVGYVLGRRHGRKRAEAKLQPEIEKLEGQIAMLYEAVSAREQLLRRVVLELEARQLGSQHSVNLQVQANKMMHRTYSEQHEVSKKIQLPSLVMPAVFAALLVSTRLNADITDEKYTWGKDFLVGGTAGYMIGRRHGRKKTETRLKSEIEQLEYEVGNLSADVLSRDSVINAMVKVVADADNQVLHGAVTSGNEIENSIIEEQINPEESANQEHPASRPSKQVEEFVDSSVDRIAVYRKNREIKRHKEHLLKSGKAVALGEFNLGSSVFLERRLIDGNENSAARKPVEVMNEGELLVMSQNIYVDGESAIDLYEKGRVELEVLRESVKQYWRKTGDYEQTLRANLKTDESAVNSIRAELEKTYKSILESA